MFIALFDCVVCGKTVGCTPDEPQPFVCDTCDKTPEGQAIVRYTPEQMDARRAAESRACEGMDTAALDVIAAAGGVKRLVELLTVVNDHFIADSPDESELNLQGYTLNEIETLVDKLASIEAAHKEAQGG